MSEKDTKNPAPAALEAAHLLQQAGHVAYWAGGCVRDRLLGRTPRDIDIATDAPPDRVTALFPNALEVGKAFGVVIVRVNGVDLEVATFRREGQYRDGRHPEHVEFCDAETDAQRRDFTVNAMFFDPVKDALHDYVGGRADLETKIIRCVGDPVRRFEDDHLRLLRAVRFATTLDFSLHSDTLAAIRQCAPALKRISMERIRDEFTRTLLEAPKAGQALRLLDDLGLLEVFLPEVSALKHQEQPAEFHPEGDVLSHVVLMLDLMGDERTPELVYSVLMHDIAKPTTASHDGDRWRFNGHAELGADMAESILARLRLPGRVIASAVHCTRNHMRFIDVQKMRTSTLRRMVGSGFFDNELALHRLDCLASHGMLENFSFLTDYRERMRAEPVLPPPWVSGRDILALGIPEGPEVGRRHRQAYDAQLEGRFPSREALLDWLQAEIRDGSDRQN